ncbi:MAG TPA: pyridoxamine 5'-phosphate oxidase family protein [Actinopolymorphaceae bacterium]|jgi:hypothetical protein
MSVAPSILPVMYETQAEVRDLQKLLDSSLSRSTRHLRSIIVPGKTAVSARQLCDMLTGMCVLSIATVTAKGEPRISAVDGHFWHGRWIFGTDASAAKARHLRARPAVSVAHLRGEELGVFTHGKVEPLVADHPDWPAILEHLTNHYGVSPTTFGDEVVYYRLQPHWMVAYGQLEKLST